VAVSKHAGSSARSEHDADRTKATGRPRWQFTPAEQAAVTAAIEADMARLGPPTESERNLFRRVWAPAVVAAAKRRIAAEEAATEAAAQAGGAAGSPPAPRTASARAKKARSLTAGSVTPGTPTVRGH
jgi:hypothetical protein